MKSFSLFDGVTESKYCVTKNGDFLKKVVGGKNGGL